MFLIRNKKIRYTPVNSNFTIYKWGLRGSKLYRRGFVMDALSVEMPHTNSDGPNERAHPCSLILTFFVHILHCPLIMQGDNEGPDQTICAG